MILVIFYDCVKVLVVNDLLNKCVIIGSIVGRLFLRILDVILLVLGVLFEGRLLMIFLIRDLVIVENIKSF